MDLSTLNVIFGADDSALVQGIQRAVAALGDFVGKAAAAGAQAGRNVSEGFRQGNAALEQNFQQLDKLTGGYERLGNAIKSAGTTLTASVTLPILGLGAASLKSAGDIQALEKGFAATYKGSEDLSFALAKVRELAKLPGLGLEEAIRGATNLQAAGLSADLATRSLQAVGNALATVGKGKADLDGVELIFSKLASTGKITERSITELSARIPQVREAMQAAFGTATAEGLKKLGIDTTTFIEGITTQLAKLPSVTGGLNNAFENLGDSATLSLAKVGNALNKNFGVEDKLNALGTFLTGLADKFAALDPSTQKLIFGLAGAAAAVGPLLVAAGSIVAVLPLLEAGFATLGVTSLTALAPILPIAAGVAAAAVLIYRNWDSLVAYFKGPNGAVFSDLADSVGAAFTSIKEALSALLNGPVGKAVAELAKLQFAFDGKVLQTAIAVVSTALTILATDLRLVVDLFRLDFAKAAEDANTGIGKIVNTVRDLLGLNTKSASFSDFFQELNTNALRAKLGIQQLDQALYDKLNTKPIAAPKVAQSDAADKAAKAIVKAFEEAQQKLASIDFRVKVGVESQFDGATERVKTLQEYIKKLADLPGGSGSPLMGKLLEQLDAAQGRFTKLLGSLQNKRAELPLTVDFDSDAIAKVQQALDKANLTAKLQFQLDGDAVKYAQSLLSNQQAAVGGLASAGVDPSNAQAQGIAGNAKVTQLQSFDADSVKQYVAALADAADQEKLFGNSFDELGAKVQAYRQRLLELAQTQREATTQTSQLKQEQAAILADQTLDPTKLEQNAKRLQVINDLLEKYAGISKQAAVASGTLAAGLKQVDQAAEWKNFTESLNQAKFQAFEGVAEVIGTQIGNIVSGVTSGQDALQNVFKGVLGVFGSFLKQLGESLVAYGTAVLAADVLASNPLSAPAAIAVGLAAIAAGAAFSSIASAGPTKSGAGASSFGSGPGVSTGAGTGSAYQATKNSSLTVNVNFAPVQYELQGDVLVHTLNVANYRIQRGR